MDLVLHCPHLSTDAAIRNAPHILRMLDSSHNPVSVDWEDRPPGKYLIALCETCQQAAAPLDIFKTEARHVSG
jgi:hypothetical protein